jgi:quinoprotein glucose dehydrogenase
VASDLIDYTPAIRDSARKLAERCRMGPYFVPPSPADGHGATGPAKYTCSWYAPGAAGGVNIDGGTAADPETGMIYVGGQSGVQPLGIQKDPCSEHAYSETHNSCGLPGALPPPAGYTATETPGRGGRGGGRGGAPSIGGVSIVKPKQLGGVTAYNLNSGDKIWWIPNGGQMRPITSTDPLFAGISLPPIPAGNGQAQVINTRTLVIYGTGRSGGAPNATPELYALDKMTGKQVGAVQIPSKTSAVPMTFMHDGKQYIVFATGIGSNTSLVALTLPR